MDRVMAVILAGGWGKSAATLHFGRLGAILPFAGRFRIIDFSLTNCIHSQIKHINVVVDRQRGAITAYLKRWRHNNKCLERLHILENQNSVCSGGADALRQSLDRLQALAADTIVVLAGDRVYRMDYRDVISFHKKTNSDLTLAVVQVPTEQADQFNTVTADHENRVLNYAEISGAPGTLRSNLATIGVYVFNKEALVRRLARDAVTDLPRDLEQVIISDMVREDQVFAYRFNGYWHNSDTVEAYYNANMALTGEALPFLYNMRWPILTETSDLSPPRISSSAVVKNSVIGPGCIVEGTVENSVLCPGVSVDYRASVKRSVLMGNNSVGYRSIIEGCVLEEKARVGNFCYIGYDAGPTSKYTKLTVLGRNVTVPAGTGIGRNCRIMPDVGPADFPAKTIAPGTVLQPQYRAAGGEMRTLVG